MFPAACRLCQGVCDYADFVPRRYRHVPHEVVTEPDHLRPTIRVLNDEDVLVRAGRIGAREVEDSGRIRSLRGEPDDAPVVLAVPDDRRRVAADDGHLSCRARRVELVVKPGLDESRGPIAVVPVMQHMVICEQQIGADKTVSRAVLFLTGRADRVDIVAVVSLGPLRCAESGRRDRSLFAVGQIAVTGSSRAARIRGFTVSSDSTDCGTERGGSVGRSLGPAAASRLAACAPVSPMAMSTLSASATCAAGIAHGVSIEVRATCGAALRTLLVTA